MPPPTQQLYIQCPGCNKEFLWADGDTKQEAANHLAACGVMPQAALYAGMSGHDEPHRQADHLSWSVIDPRTTCIREVLISRFWPRVVLNPQKKWAATSGIIWHGAMQLHAPPDKVEIKLPFPADGLKTDFTAGRGRLYRGVTEFEIFPGIWYSTKVDYLDLEAGDCIDYKTTNSPGPNRDYGLKEEWILQLTLTLRMLRELEDVVPQGQVGVWRMYAGHSDPATTWRWFPMPNLVKDAERLEAAAEVLIRPHAELLVSKCQECMGCQDEAGLRDIIKTLPLSGQAMFASKDGRRNKCTHYCAHRDICYYSIQGIESIF